MNRAAKVSALILAVAVFATIAGCTTVGCVACPDIAPTNRMAPQRIPECAINLNRCAWIGEDGVRVCECSQAGDCRWIDVEEFDQ